jgi:diacylglycerol O-acyltransferase / wax synthase
MARPRVPAGHKREAMATGPLWGGDRHHCDHIDVLTGDQFAARRSLIYGHGLPHRDQWPCQGGKGDHTIGIMTAPGGAYLGASDAFTWRMERDPALRSTIVVVDWLDRAPDWDALVARVDRISRLMPSLRQRVVESPFGLTAPRWSYDPHFDLDWHVRRVGAPAPRTREAVLQLARRSAMDAFDRDRPLWELTLVEGIEDGQAALIVKFHHSLSDGVGGMRMLAIMADPQRKPPDLGPLPPAPAGQTPDQLALVTGTAGAMAGQLTGLARRGAEAAVPALARSVREPFGLACGTAAMARSVYRTAAPSSGAMSPLMRDRSMTRQLAMMRLSLDALKKAAKTAEGTVNDAYLAVVTGGLRRYHERHGATVESMRAVIPISLRTAQDTGWGNKITLMRLTVPAGEPDPAARMRLLHRLTEAAREEPSLPVTGAIAGALNMLPVGYLAGILKHADFVASNVPGVAKPVYVAGGKVTGMFAFGPTIGTSLNTTLLSYAGTCDIGINIDTAAVPDPDVLLACLEESAAEITALGGAGRDRAPASRGPDRWRSGATAPERVGVRSIAGDRGLRNPRRASRSRRVVPQVPDDSH